ncbi:MAG: hypothetical protein ACP5O2_11860 [Bacteroidales bacterium]
MNSDNQRIIDTVKMMGCNTIFFSVSTLKYADSSNTENLGINPYVHSNGVRYLDKMVDFLDKCANQGIKVFALTVDDPTYVLTENHHKARKKISRIAYYQYHVRLDPYNQSFKTKKAHFHGVVTNLEPWALDNVWYDNLCDLNNAAFDNNILSQYLALIPQLRYKLEFGYTTSFFNPPQPQGPPQALDGLFMGTVHWFWHYFSQIHPTTFPNGNFSLYVGMHGGAKYFDAVMPETYCPKNGNTCINLLPCTDPSCNPCGSGTYQNCESIGKCYQWFENHFILGLEPGYPAGAVRPIDAAPMLYGHSAFQFSTLSDLHSTRWYAEDVTRSCYGKGRQYLGSFTYHYEELKQRFDGRVGALPSLECQAFPDEAQGAFNVSQECLPHRFFKCYPNPVTNVLTIEGLQAGERCLLYNDKLEPVVIHYSSSLDVSEIPNGLYYLVITDEKSNILYRTQISIKRP